MKTTSSGYQIIRQAAELAAESCAHWPALERAVLVFLIEYFAFDPVRDHFSELPPHVKAAAFAFMETTQAIRKARGA